MQQGQALLDWRVGADGAEEILAIGDNWNDVSMLEAAGSGGADGECSRRSEGDCGAGVDGRWVDAMMKMALVEAALEATLASLMAR